MTEWYYRDAQSRKIGPLSTDEFEERVTEGEIHAHTRVWRSGLLDWLTYEALLAHESNCLAFASGPSASAAPQSHSSSTFVALAVSATHRPPREVGSIVTPAATPHPTLAPTFELCPRCDAGMPAPWSREMGRRRICRNCGGQMRVQAERDRRRNARGVDSNWLGKYFVRLALVTAALVAIRILLMEMDGRHPATASALPVLEAVSDQPVAQKFDSATGSAAVR